ncbi:MAG: rhodanese-like domain-containing protein [Moraxellaceae bacterium]|nr:rhodanese-like domain-containing protein [Moraxellaceae bacterium]
MTTQPEILEQAKARATQLRVPYAGCLTPGEAHALLQAQPEAKLVDVRTRAELDWVGRIPGAVEIEWNSWPGSVPNPNFVGELRRLIEPGAPVLFICRSGARSHAAAVAASNAGFTSSFNVLEGFEGDRDPQGHRGQLGGWRHAGLPWAQS